MKKVRAAPRRIPAFGDWNYYDDDWPASQYLDSAMAMQAGLVIALPASSPKPRKKVVKWSDSGTLEVVDGEQKKQRQQHKVVVGLPMRGEHGARKQSRVCDADASYMEGRRAVKAVDADLYVIPPDMLFNNNHPRPRRRLLTKRLWIIGCLVGLSCVA